MGDVGRFKIITVTTKAHESNEMKKTKKTIAPKCVSEQRSMVCFVVCLYF